ncbi:DEAD/DEAH box helicase [unidentified bacterial endosymbiont]|uniref:DEAD/DEAH box helicase n=1 Tax=unidentified bacterial endosymbiont TaxID=2355 RepID=UPI00264658D1|nr:DEAD/DEAH box helicase [unidentified bacterial endosymbiont]
MSDTDTQIDVTFAELGLPASILAALEYDKPTPIQKACIPALLSGRDVLGMAQTGSGKTAAFALPLLSRIKADLACPQLLVLAPTRELAVQVAKACKEYAQKMPGIKVLAIYGGQRYDLQLQALRQGPQVVVGTPGRLLDHLRRGKLDLTHLQGLVLDEADEMLRMGFIDDVETIMAELPKGHQTALFSATMPEAIRRITRRFMRDPEVVHIQSHVRTAPEITQHYWLVYGLRKSEALVRFLEAEPFDAALIFVKTKNATVEVAERLEQSGLRCAALNGDMNQSLREQTLERLKDGRLDILIATDVAARGLDVERISLVVNYDIPMDCESYVHRIGRTGRAGRSGRALLFVDQRERRLLGNIERTLRLTITPVELPSNQQVAAQRLSKFATQVSQQLESHDLEQYRGLLLKLGAGEEQDLESLAAALLKIAQGDRPLILPPEVAYEQRTTATRGLRERDAERFPRERRAGGDRDRARSHADMMLYRIEVGRDDGVEVRHIVGAIANEGDFSSRNIGNIKLFPAHSTVELPKGLSSDLINHFARTRILNKPMRLQLIGETSPTAPRRERFERSNTGRAGERSSRQEYRPAKRFRTAVDFNQP